MGHFCSDRELDIFAENFAELGDGQAIDPIGREEERERKMMIWRKVGLTCLAEIIMKLLLQKRFIGPPWWKMYGMTGGKISFRPPSPTEM